MIKQGRLFVAVFWPHWLWPFGNITQNAVLGYSLYGDLEYQDYISSSYERLLKITDGVFDTEQKLCFVGEFGEDKVFARPGSVRVPSQRDLLLMMRKFSKEKGWIAMKKFHTCIALAPGMNLSDSKKLLEIIRRFL